MSPAHNSKGILAAGFASTVIGLNLSPPPSATPSLHSTLQQASPHFTITRGGFLLKFEKLFLDLNPDFSFAPGDRPRRGFFFSQTFF